MRLVKQIWNWFVENLGGAVDRMNDGDPYEEWRVGDDDEWIVKK
jgi:hypothetical protein